LTADRRESIAAYSARFEQLNTRVKKSLDHAWNIFGRVVARQSLVKLTGDLDDLRRRYEEFVASQTVDSPTFDSLGASGGALASTLSQDRAGFTRAEGAGWYAKSRDDLQAMSDARKRLLQIDRQRKEGARQFADDSATVSRIVERMEKTETYVAGGAAPAGAGGTAGTAGTRTTDGTPAGGAAGAASATSAAGVPVRPSAQTTTVEQHNQGNGVLLAWLSGGVLLLVVYISAGTVVSIVRPVRRLLKVTAQIATGKVALPSRAAESASSTPSRWRSTKWPGNWP
jgi:hypothetical protein